MLLPLVGALLIAISRCEDYRHDVYDVTVGSALGLTVAYLSYRRYYPPLRAAGCDAPISSRGERSGSSDARPGYGAVGDAPDDDEALPLRERDLESGGG